jgi:hypothetical protein
VPVAVPNGTAILIWKVPLAEAVVVTAEPMPLTVTLLLAAKPLPVTVRDWPAATLVELSKIDALVLLVAVTVSVVEPLTPAVSCATMVYVPVAVPSGTVMSTWKMPLAEAGVVTEEPKPLTVTLALSVKPLPVTVRDWPATTLVELSEIEALAALVMVRLAVALAWLVCPTANSVYWPAGAEGIVYEPLKVPSLSAV